MHSPAAVMFPALLLFAAQWTIHPAQAAFPSALPPRVVSRTGAVPVRDRCVGVGARAGRRTRTTVPLRPFPLPPSSSAATTDLRSSSSETDSDPLPILLSLLARAPSNRATSGDLTRDILDAVRNVEPTCPSSPDDVLDELAGTWELLWTAQDPKSEELSSSLLPTKMRTWINPLENQSYSNNPSGIGRLLGGGGGDDESGGAEQGVLGGRANPVLPRAMQEALEDWGIIDRPSSTSSERSDARGDGGEAFAAKSTQTVDLERGFVRNVVSAPLPSSPLLAFPSPFLLFSSSKPRRRRSRRATLTVDVDFKPNASDARRIDVKFRSCRVILPSPLRSGGKIDATLPLGPIGPTGWLRTTYIDDSVRITRGHKGSVFVLKRAGGGGGGR